MVCMVRQVRVSQPPCLYPKCPVHMRATHFCAMPIRSMKQVHTVARGTEPLAGIGSTSAVEMFRAFEGGFNKDPKFCILRQPHGCIHPEEPAVECRFHFLLAVLGLLEASKTVESGPGNLHLVCAPLETIIGSTDEDPLSLSRD